MVTKFALQVYMMWVHQSTVSSPVWPSFRPQGSTCKNPLLGQPGRHKS